MSLQPLTADLEAADAEQIGEAVYDVVAQSERLQITKLLQVCEHFSKGVVRTNGWPLCYYYDVLMKVARNVPAYQFSGVILDQAGDVVSHSYISNLNIAGYTAWGHFMLMRFAWISSRMLIRDTATLGYAEPTFALYTLYAHEGSIVERMNNYRG